MCSRKEGSLFWRRIQCIKYLIREGARHEVGDGVMTHFWLDRWSGQASLRETFPSLYAICNEPDATVAEVCRNGHWNLLFRRSFRSEEAVDWQALLALATDGLSQVCRTRCPGAPRRRVCSNLV